jgi:hypothetical protein
MLMRARLEVDVKSPTSGTIASGRESFLLGVPLALQAVKPLARQVPFGIQNDGADHRVGARPVIGLAGKLDGTGGPMQVYGAVTLRGMQAWKYTEPKQTTA